MQKVKCYHVQTKDAELHELIFAKKRSAAIHASEAYGIVDWIDLKATRVAEFDPYAEQGNVPKAVLLEHGWYFECSGRHTDSRSCSRVLSHDDNPLTIDEHVYCNQECYDNATKSVEG